MGKPAGKHRTYTLDASTGSYMVITFWPFRPGNAFAVQVNSDDALPIPTLHGLTLGASREELIAAVGAPSSERPVADLARTLLLYDGRNYSFEVDSSLRLVSARISGYTGVLSGEGWPQNWEAYRPYSIGQAVTQIPTDGDVNLVPPGALGFQALVQNTKTLRIILSETERHILELSLRSASFEADVLASGLESTVAVLVTEGGQEWWVMLQAELATSFLEVGANQWVELYGSLLGAAEGGKSPVYLVNAFRATPFPPLPTRLPPTGLAEGLGH